MSKTKKTKDLWSKQSTTTKDKKSENRICKGQSIWYKKSKKKQATTIGCPSNSEYCKKISKVQDLSSKKRFPWIKYKNQLQRVHFQKQ